MCGQPDTSDSIALVRHNQIEGEDERGCRSADPKAGTRTRRPILGRDPELERLFGMIDQIAGHGGALVIRGEAGIGKSALLEAAGERAREHGATVVSTTGTQSEKRL